ncbi:PspC domain-containing protein [Pseudactinotalea terrae]|uniref:PspC domain-containing protein n=1 Tax=Pseudactinotalea terrae TaxID=1743262 RepID=UPI0012E2B9ED|nr:PspC domain-containing protein [Pseudactinotalea terrae]
MENIFDSIRKLGYQRGPERIAGGICGGIAAKAGISVTIVRIGMLLAFLLPFFGVAAYLVGWLLLPWQDGTIPLERLLSPRR